MIAQLRTYTVNRGMMASWITLFTEVLVPMQARHGIKVDAAWANADGTEFIWVRGYADEAEQRAREASFYGSPEWLAIRDRVVSHLAKTESKLMTPVLAASGPAAALPE